MYNAVAKDENYFLLSLPGVEAQPVKLLYPGQPAPPKISLLKSLQER